MNLAVYCLLFIAVGVGFIFVHLVAGKLIRPNKPGAEKKTIYECGEPTIGSAWIQFDLRFYVVALLFVIFDVEVAFFFPWAEVFGRANDVAAMTPPTVADRTIRRKPNRRLPRLLPKVLALAPPTRSRRPSATPMSGWRTATGAGSPPTAPTWTRDVNWRTTPHPRRSRTPRSLAWLAFFEILVFFGVLLVGFAYLWRRGDLAWVRSIVGRAGRCGRRRRSRPPWRRRPSRRWPASVSAR